MKVNTIKIRNYDLADLPEEYLRTEFPQYYGSIKKLKMKDLYTYLPWLD